MKRNKKLLIGLIVMFVVLLGTTLFVSFSSNIDEQEIVIKSMTPVYDENSGVVVSEEGVVFNDKNQVVKYNVVLENTQDYDVKISDIKLSTPTEEFLDYKVEGISTDDVVAANSTKELVVSFETMRINGWGRNFADELTANISFEKVVKQEEVTPPADKEEDKQPEAPATNTEELITKAEEIEVIKVTKDTIEFKETEKLQVGDKLAVWLYSEPIFLGYFDVVETNGVKQIVSLEEALKKDEIKSGEHNIVLVSEENETLGYINVYINEDKEVLKEKPQDTTDKEESDVTNKEESNTDGNVPTKPNTDSNNKDENTKDDENKVENPYTSDKGLIIILGLATCITGIAIIMVSKNKFAKYTVFILMLSPALTITNADEVIELSIKNNVSFESQNVMAKSYETEKHCYYDYEEEEEVCYDYNEYLYFWSYREEIRNIYIQNEITEIDDYYEKYDITEEQNGRVLAYLVGEVVEHDPDEGDIYEYDLYLMADGIIYPNKNASYYFAEMSQLQSINNLAGIDTRNVTNMSYMFYYTGRENPNFTLDVSSFDISNVTDMSYMFSYTGRENPNFTLDLSCWDTSNITDMSYMFYDTRTQTLDLSNFDTSNVTDMSYMFYDTGTQTLDLSNFDTSNVTNMRDMFGRSRLISDAFILDISGWDTSNVTDMSYMFYNTGSNSETINLDLSGWDTSNVTDMNSMFFDVEPGIKNLTLDLSGWDTSNVTDMSSMFANEYDDVYDPDFTRSYTLDLSGWDTSNVTDMSSMFYQTGYENPNFTLDVSHFDTSKVTNMSYMFADTGYNSENFTLDVSHFDTSKVTNMSYMFGSTGYSSTKLNTSITIKNANITWYNGMFKNVATQPGSQIKVNYTSNTESLVAEMIKTKQSCLRYDYDDDDERYCTSYSPGGNVVKGELVD